MSTVMLAADSTAVDQRRHEIQARTALPAREGAPLWRRIHGLASGLLFLAAHAPLYMGLLLFSVVVLLAGVLLYGIRAIGLRLTGPAGAATATALALICIATPQRAKAAGVGSDSPLLQQTTLVFSQQTNLYAFDAPGAGTLTVTLKDLDFPVALQQLTASILSNDQVPGSLPSGNSSGSFQLPISNGGIFDAFVSAQSGSAQLGGYDLQIGAYSLTVGFTPVPLPAALDLLLGGIGLLGAVSLVERVTRRRNRDVISVA